MSSESPLHFNDHDLEALFSALGGSIDRVLQTTNSVKIRGLGVFRKGEDGISFEASEDLDSFVNVDFEGLDVVSYDPSDLARSHLKREEFSFEEEEFSSASKQTEIVTPVVLATDGFEHEILESEELIPGSLEEAEIASVEDAELTEVEEMVEEAAVPSIEEPNPFDIETEENQLTSIEEKAEADFDVEKIIDDSVEEDILNSETQLPEVEVEPIESENSLVDDRLGNLKSDAVSDELAEVEDSGTNQEWLPKDNPEWMKDEEQEAKPFVFPIKKSEKEFAEKDDQEIRRRRQNAKLQRQRQKKRRLGISFFGLLFVVAALTLFWWLINSGNLDDVLDRMGINNGVSETRSTENVVALESEVIEPAVQDSLYLDIPVIDYSDPNSIADLDRGKFTWILYSSNERRDALARSKFYRDAGYENDVIKVNLRGLDTYRVSFGRFSGFREATEADSTLPNGIQGTWVDKLEDSFNLSQSVK